MLMERLFSSGLMQMGPSRNDASRQVGIFNPGAVGDFAAMRSAKMQEFRWLAGEWNYENAVPASRVNPAYSDVGSCRYSLCEKGNWICIVAPDGRETPHITFDPFGKLWIYLLMNGAYGILRSQDGWQGNQIAFNGLMTMIGFNCDWRMRWTKESEDRFSFINEERDTAGAWAYIDEWHFVRKG